MLSKKLSALAEGLGFSEPSVQMSSASDQPLMSIPSPETGGPALPETGGPALDLTTEFEPEHATALRMNARYFIQSSMERYGYNLEDSTQMTAVEDEILSSRRYAMSFFEQPRELGAAPPDLGAKAPPSNVWLNAAEPRIVPIPIVDGDPDFLPENEYRLLVSGEEARRTMEYEAPDFWISRMRYFEDTFGFRYRVTYVNEAGKERRIRSFTPDAAEIFQVMTDVPKPGWKIDEIAVSCHCDGKGMYATVRDPSNWKDKVHSKKIYAREEDRPETKPEGEKCEPYEHSLESHMDAFRDLYTPDARVILLMCWSVRVHNVILEPSCGKDVHYFKQECWISPFKLDLKGWYWDVATMAAGRAPSGQLPEPLDCAELARKYLLGGDM